MSDFESTGAIGGDSTGGGSVAPDTGSAGYGSGPVNGESDAEYDQPEAAMAEDGGEDGESDPIAEAERRYQEMERRLKGAQKSIQEAVERAKRAEQAIARTQQQLPPTREEQAFLQKYQALQAQQYYLSPEQYQAGLQELNREAYYLHQERQIRQREQRIQQAERQLAPLGREQAIKGIKDQYRGLGFGPIPDRVFEHAQNRAMAEHAAYVWSLSQNVNRDRQRTEQLEQEASQASRTPSARSGSGSSAAVQKQLAELEKGTDLAALLAFRSKHGLNKKQRVRV